MNETRFPRIASLKTADAFRRHLTGSQIDLRFDESVLAGDSSPLGSPLTVGDVTIGNRFCILPMEGWDGTADGRPSDLTIRRWRNFGRSGARLIWGGEAVAVRPDGRANPNQLVLTAATQQSLAELRTALVDEHRASFGERAASRLYIGLQLTHSGRFSRPNAKHRPEPLAAYRHPVLDARFAEGVRVLSDDQLDRLVEEFVCAAKRAHAIGFDFVDVKHCHGYLLHELLSARTREGRYGGQLANRTRFMFDVIDGIHAEVPGLSVAVRLSIFDIVPFRKGASGRGEPAVTADHYPHAFGLLENEQMDEALADARELLRMLQTRGIRWICTTAGSPYYCPHIQRPAAFPPVDGYDPPEDPLRGVARQIDATARLKACFPDMAFVGSGYSYLQEWLPNVAQYAVRHGMTDFVGIGRLALSYPDMPADVLGGRPLRRKSLCRTFSDCTTGPRLGLVSGCYPLDAFYADHPDAVRLREIRTAAKS